MFVHCLLGPRKLFCTGSHHPVGGGVLGNSLSVHTFPLVTSTSGLRALCPQSQASSSDHASGGPQLQAASPSLSARPQVWPLSAPGPPLLPSTALPKGPPSLAQTPARAPLGSPPPAFARRTFQQAIWRSLRCPKPLRGSPFLTPQGRTPGGRLVNHIPCHTLLSCFLCTVPHSRSTHPAVGGWLLCGRPTPAACVSCPLSRGQVGMSPSRAPAQSLAPKGLPLSRAGVQVLEGMECPLFSKAVPDTPSLTAPHPSRPLLVPCSGFPPSPLLSEITCC